MTALLFDSHAHVDGPEFDAHQVDFAVLAKRNTMYHAAERGACQRQ